MEQNRTVFLIVEDNGQTKWRHAGTAYVCKDGSMNIKLDMFPNLTFNARPPKSIKEGREAAFGENVPELKAA